jgi:amino acid adenylation domain-containing protein
VQELQPERRATDQPLFQVMFALQNAPQSELLLTRLKLESLQVDGLIPKFDLALAMLQENECLHGSVIYRAKLMKSAIISRMMAHYTRLLEGIVENPEQRISELPMLLENEREQVLMEWNETGAVVPKGCIGQLFEDRVRRMPDAFAVEQRGRRLTYVELNGRANRWAHYLRKRGIGREMVVGVCLERSVEMVVVLLGILKAGGAYVCLDAGYPDERLRFMVEDSEAAVVIGESRMRERLRLRREKFISVEEEGGKVERQSEENAVSEVESEDLAYLTYTSGSTGQPKATEVPHRAVGGYMFGVGYAKWEGETFLHYSSSSWDALTLELWTPLLHGARCVVYGKKAVTLEGLEETIREEGVSTLWMTSSFFNLVMDQRPGALQGLRQLLVGGEALSVKHIQRALEVLPGVKVVNGYGPSECTVFSCCYPVSQVGGMERSIPIGRPVGDRKVYLLNKYLQPVPIGAIGELFVGGPGVGRGYRKQAMQTAESFVPDPFGEAGGRLYRTGDLGMYQRGGNIEYKGRKDEQVKLRGYRIELEEVVSVIRRYEGVANCVVVVREDGGGEKRLVAYVVGKEEPCGELAAGVHGSEDLCGVERAAAAGERKSESGEVAGAGAKAGDRSPGGAADDGRGDPGGDFL